MITIPSRVSPLLILASLLRIACSGGFQASVSNANAARLDEPADSTVKSVIIDHFKYEPDTLTVSVGATVEWNNIDIVPHTATAVDQKPFDSGPIAKGRSWRFTARRKGTYDYLCTLHPNMRAKLIVE